VFHKVGWIEAIISKDGLLTSFEVCTKMTKINNPNMIETLDGPPAASLAWNAFVGAALWQFYPAFGRQTQLGRDRLLPNLGADPSSRTIAFPSDRRGAAVPPHLTPLFTGHPTR